MICMFYIRPFLVVALIVFKINGAENPRHEISMDQGWLFSLENPTGAELPTFNDTAWRKLDVPHD
jgi:beta-galactosidase